ncbi:MAG: DUF4230 domain-containing protein [Chitinispirillia bacterium]|nr:DUF4230 domain-containing protein [Chitinispirillia bacterium]MCL2242345.1 DUF4230 domain-containing protein [Chitinispirillia bacterium]
MFITYKIVKKLLLPAVLVIAAVLAVQFLPLRQLFGGAAPVQEINVSTLARQILPAAEFVSLHYKYSELFEDRAENLRNIWNLPIPQTGREIWVIADGTVKFGINCRNIKIDTASYYEDSTRYESLIVTFPPIQIISHEFDIRRIRDMSGVFRKPKPEEYPEMLKRYKAEAELKARRDRELYSQARMTTQAFFEQLFNAIPALSNTKIEFRWGVTVPVEEKRG